MSDTTMTAEQATALREPFSPSLVGKLPRITCPACSKAQGRCCNEHSKKKCAECDNWITERHIHLDYVGHGAVTHRLLEVDAEWNWEPLGADPAGMPAFVESRAGNPIGLWIKLTVGGVTRLGFGSCPDDQKDPEKVLIGDALRNAAMRFGVALDLWVKGHAEDDERSTATAVRSGPARRTEPGPDERGLSAKDVGILSASVFAEAAAEAPEGQRTKVHERLRHSVVHAATKGRTASLGDCTPADLVKVWTRLKAIEDGAVTFVHDALDDGAGVTFTSASGDRVVLWSEFEAEPAPEPLPHAREAYAEAHKAQSKQAS